MGLMDKITGKDKQKGGHMHAMGASPEAGGKLHEDPICHMQVDEKKAAATSQYKGQTYYFCAAGCKKTFDANPEKYLGGSGAKHKDGCCG